MATSAPAFAAIFLLLLASACFGSHGTAPTGPAADAGPPRTDAGRRPVDPPDDPPIVVPPGCGELPERQVRVELSSETGARCEYGTFEGAAIYDLSTRPELDGVSLLVDFCPGADADCVCDVVVSGVGTDIADEIAGATSGGFVRAQIAPSGIVLERPCARGSCPDGMCSCIATLVLAAADGSIDDPPVQAEALGVTAGPELCRLTDAGECDYVTWSLTMVTWSSGFPGAIGTETLVAHGQTVRGEDAAGLSLRALRASGYDCGGEIPRAAAWAAWGRFTGP